MEPDDFKEEDYARQNYRETLSTSPVPLVVLDEELSILLASRPFLTAFGLQDPPIGSAINQILPSDRLSDKIRGVQLRWSIEELEHRIKILDGSEATEEFTQARFELEMNGRPL